MNVTLIPGDGIGPEVAAATQRVIDAVCPGIVWDIQPAGADVLASEGDPLPDRVIDSIRRTGVALKGPVTTPVGTGFRSVNVRLRQALDLYINLRPAKTLQNIPSRFSNVDLIIFRENTEDLYAGIEHMVGLDAAESIKIFTRRGCERILHAGFSYAQQYHRKKVTVVHKANIMKCTDGMFLQIAREIAPQYPAVAFEDRIVDAMCMNLVMAPEDYDVLILPNLYGDIVSDLCAGLTGGLGVAPGANIGEHTAVFEAIHGSAPDIAGQQIANPLALMRSGIMMLDHCQKPNAAAALQRAIERVLADGRVLTADLGGTASTDAFATAVIDALSAH